MRKQVKENYEYAAELWRQVLAYLRRVDGTNDGFDEWNGSDVQLNIRPGAINRVTLK